MTRPSSTQLARFLEERKLPSGFRTLIERHYQPLADWLYRAKRRDVVELIGISGAQGTGKSTLADYLGLALTATRNWSVAKLSLDDFYLTRAERRRPCRTARNLRRIELLQLPAHLFQAPLAQAEFHGCKIQIHYGALPAQIEILSQFYII